mmetsp:Transcript_14583/g.12386  ORF Transcript_14583/g.12386 Transcript_14583/m.12386 type:complete len:242 (+) Transcript_14583:69-794(+)
MDYHTDDARRGILQPIGRTYDRSQPEDFRHGESEIEHIRKDFIPRADKLLNTNQEELIVKGDSKTEVHFIGHITGGANFDTTEGLFCEMILQVGEDWVLLSEDKLYQTQTCYADVDEIFVWAHPIDINFVAADLKGWPKAIFIIWRLDDNNKIDTFSYGVTSLPRTKGHHKVTCDTFSPMGDRHASSLSFFLGTFPRLKDRDIVAKSLDKREHLSTLSSGKVILEIDVITKNFEKLGVSDC